MPNSMTGFGSAEGPVLGGRLAVDVRTVNHRHLNVQCRLPAALQALETAIRTRIKERMERGQVTVAARWAEPPAQVGKLQLDLERARAVVAALRELKEVLELPGDIDVTFVARQPEVLTVPEEVHTGVPEGEVLAIVDRAVDGGVAAREREGETLVRDLVERLEALDRGVAIVEMKAPERLVAERNRLRSVVRELLDGRTIDEDRLEQELALVADKLDVTEELVRLRAHVTACREALGRDGPVGRELSFLGQEMLREVNTIGSKANHAEIARQVIGMKGEIDKLREQVENLE